MLLPLRGFIDLSLDGVASTVSYGDCVVIVAGCYHEFRAREDFRFLVIDVEELPNKLLSLSSPILALDAATHQYVAFIEQQLQQAISDELESHMLTLLFRLLSDQCTSCKMDARIKHVVQFLNQDVQQTPSIAQLAQLACLSQSQFKLLFTKQLGVSPLKYLVDLKMKKAQALLINSDMPISRIAEEVGFSNPSSFSRSFNAHLGQAPKAYRAREKS
ncbi:AraC family transcriptional regulator [Vibrio sp. JPW-9-11-11]|nr:AraC family transcriptional regulator [Vibrio sp. JPW-9-11-11]